MFRLNTLSKAVLVLCTGAAVGNVVAQQQQQAAQPQRIEITGSRIKRIDSETPSPIQVIGREQIERAGATTVAELLKSTPAGNSGSFDENAVASFTPGAGSVSLRGLGAQATLVLVNGRRVAPYGFASGGQQTFVDINSIPLAVVEKIEILLDGASAIYGSDAMAGVINIILKHDYKGFAVEGGVGQSGYQDANSASVGLTYGMGSIATDGYNIFGSYSHQQRSPVRASDRPMTANGDFRRFGLTDLRSSYSGNLYTVSGLAGGAFRGTLSTCTPLDEPGAATNGRCVYDGTAHQDVIAKTERDSLFLAGTAELGSGTTLFGDLNLVRNKYAQISPSYSSSTYYSTGTLPTAVIVLPVGHPQNPGTTDLALRYRFDDVEHKTSVVNDTQRMVLGARNENVFGWDAETALMYSHSNAKVTTTGFIRDSVLLDGVLDPETGKANTTFIFGNPSANNAALMSALYPTLHETGTTTTTSVDVRGTREVFSLPGGGTASLAVGLEARGEKFNSTPDPLSAAGEISVLGSSESHGSRTVSAAYAELSLPFTKTFELSMAARMDHYSDFGTATTPKLGAKWKVLPNLAFRATYAEGFRAPSLTETTQSPTTGFYSGIRDPKLCPDPTDETNDNCSLSVRAVSGSNPNLKPEHSKSFTAGLVFEPTDNVSIAFDAYRVKRTDEISGIDPDYLLAHESEYPGYVVRDPDTDEIKQLNLQYTNLGSTRVWGFDVDIKTSFSLAEYGKLKINGVYNYLPSYWVANVKGAPEVDYAGTWQQPKERMSLGATWEQGPWTVGITWRYTGSYLRAFTPSDLSCSYSVSKPSLCSVASWTTADGFLGYKGFKNLELGLVVLNIDNREAPLDERRATRYTLFSSNYHNQLGRYFRAQAKYNFW